MFEKILETIQTFSEENISSERKAVLQPLVQYIQSKKDRKEAVRFNFICTHNSRRSHLSQIWAQTMASYFHQSNVVCYSGGTEATAMFPKIAETLHAQGFHIHTIAATENPVYTIKFAADEAPLICFSKTYNHPFNPEHSYAAILTCDSANEACPIVLGAEARFAVMYKDPKAYDHTEFQDEKYREKSLEIAQEMWWIFKTVAEENESYTTK